MSKDFTAEEVRKSAAWLHQWERKSGARTARKMLEAYADTLSKPADSGRVAYEHGSARGERDAERWRHFRHELAIGNGSCFAAMSDAIPGNAEDVPSVIEGYIDAGMDKYMSAATQEDQS